MPKTQFHASRIHNKKYVARDYCVVLHAIMRCSWFHGTRVMRCRFWRLFYGFSFLFQHNTLILVTTKIVLNRQLKIWFSTNAELAYKPNIIAKNVFFRLSSTTLALTRNSVRKLLIKLEHVDTIFVHSIEDKVFLHRIGGLVWRNCAKLQHNSLNHFSLSFLQHFCTPFCV